jgi:hypothetical protein
VQLTLLGKYRIAAVRSGPSLGLAIRGSVGGPLTGFHASENICSAVVTAIRPTLSRGRWTSTLRG